MRLKSLILGGALLCLFVVPAYGQGVRYDNIALKPLAVGGVTAVSGALITVCTSAGTGTPCTPKVANIYADEALTIPIIGTGNTGTTNSDANGNYGFYIAPGSYVITITGTGIVSSTSKVTLPCTPSAACTMTGSLTVSGAATVGVLGNVATKAFANDQVRYVSNNGNDSNDGLSWGSAKLTIAGACASITNQDATCLQPKGFGGLYIAQGYTGSIPAGLLTGQATALDIIGPAYMQADSSLVTSAGAIINYNQESYLALFDGGFQMAVQAGPRGKECFPITSTSVTANVLTVNVSSCTQTFANGEVVYLSGTLESFLNGQKVTVSTATATQFTAPFTHANYSQASDTGVASQRNILAASTMNLPDLAHGTSTPGSGYILGMDTTAATNASGHCLSGNGADGTAFDSLVGCNGNVTFPSVANGVGWFINGGNNLFLQPKVTPVGALSQTLPNQNGMVAVNAVGDTVYGTYRVTADQTITAGASLVAIPGLSWTMPANTALNVSFSCHGSYSQATAAASDSFGIQDVSVAPTNIYAKKTAYLSTSTFLADNLPTLATTTATAIGAAFTPSAPTTVFNFDIDGTIEQPSNASTSVVQIMAQFTTNNGTIKRGSFCQVW